MDYKRIYDSIIDRARSRVLLEGTYTENHHIIPRCMSGSDDKINLIKLLAREHCLVHLLLVKIYPDIKELVYAAFMMYNERSCRRYEWLRLKFIQENSGENHPRYGIPITDEQKQKQSLALKGRPHTSEHTRKASEARTGILHSEETKQKIRDKLKGRPMTVEQKSNFLKVMNTSQYRENFLRGMEKKKNMSDYAGYRLRLSIAHKGKILPPEQKLKMSLAQQLRRKKETLQDTKKEFILC